jgi:hypothetical protein
MGVAVGPCSCNGSLVWTLFVLKLEEGGGGSGRRGARARMETVGDHEACGARGAGCGRCIIAIRVSKNLCS